MKTIFVTGGSGYVGRRLIPALLGKGYAVKALVRPGSETRIPEGCELVSGNALEADSYAKKAGPVDLFIHLVGVAHPGPAKRRQFVSVDLESTRQALVAGKQLKPEYFIYMSVAQTPSGIMKDYQEARARGEEEIKLSGINYVFLRPWYIVGPGHYWPLLFLPVMKLLELIPMTSHKAKAFRLVYLRQMISAILFSVEFPGEKTILEVNDIRKF